jgi:hypothetical protein
MSVYVDDDLSEYYDEKSNDVLHYKIYNMLNFAYTKKLIDDHNFISNTDRNLKSSRLFKLICWILYTKVRYLNGTNQLIKVRGIKMSMSELMLDFIKELYSTNTEIYDNITDNEKAKVKNYFNINLIYSTIRYVTNYIYIIMDYPLSVYELISTVSEKGQGNFQIFSTGFRSQVNIEDVGFVPFGDQPDVKDIYKLLSENFRIIINKFEQVRNLNLKTPLMKHFNIVMQSIFDLVFLIFLNEYINKGVISIVKGELIVKEIKFNFFPEPTRTKGEIFDFTKLITNSKELDNRLSKFQSLFFVSQIGGFSRAYKKFKSKRGGTNTVLNKLITGIYTYITYRSPLTWEKLSIINKENLTKYIIDTEKFATGATDLEGCKIRFDNWSHKLGKDMLNALHDHKQFLSEIDIKLLNLDKYFKEFFDWRRDLNGLLLRSVYKTTGTIETKDLKWVEELITGDVEKWNYSNIVEDGNLTPYDVIKVCYDLVGAAQKFSTYEEHQKPMKLLKDMERNLTEFINEHSKFSELEDKKPIPGAMKDYLNFALYVEYLPLSLILYIFLKKFKEKEFKLFDHQSTMSELGLNGYNNYGEYVQVYEMAWLMVCMSKVKDLEMVITLQNPINILNTLRNAELTQERIISIETTKREFVLRNYIISNMNKFHFEKIILPKIQTFFKGNNFEKYIPVVPLEWESKSKATPYKVFNYGRIGEQLKVYIMTKRKSYTQSILSPIAFYKFYDDNKEVIAGLDEKILRHTAITQKKFISIYDQYRIQEFVKLINKFFKDFIFIKKMGIKYLCGDERSLIFLQKFFNGFAKTFFGEDMFRKIKWNYNIFDSDPKIVGISDQIKREFVFRRVISVRKTITDFHTLFKKTFQKNYAKNIDDHVILMKKIFGPKTPLDSGDALRSLMREGTRRLEVGATEFLALRKRDEFIRSLVYREYIKTLNKEKNSYDYNYFHALSEINNLATEKVKKFQDYKEYIYDFFNLEGSRFLTSQYTCGSRYDIKLEGDDVETFNKFKRRSLLGNLIDRFLNIAKDKESGKYKKVLSIRKKYIQQ